MPYPAARNRVDKTERVSQTEDISGCQSRLRLKITVLKNPQARTMDWKRYPCLAVAIGLSGQAARS